MSRHVSDGRKPCFSDPTATLPSSLQRKTELPLSVRRLPAERGSQTVEKSDESILAYNQSNVRCV